MEFEAKKLLMERLDKNLLHHAKELFTGDGPRIVDIYRLQGLVEALLHFADPLNVSYCCWEENTHAYSFPICDLLRETRAKEHFAAAEPEPPKKLSVREQLQAAMQETRRQSVPRERPKGGEAR